MKKVSLFSFFIWLSLQVVLAQDLQFTQFHRLPAWINPALTATSGAEFQVSTHNRIQWRGLDKGYTTLSAGFEYNHINNLSFGVLIVQDNILGQAWQKSGNMLPFGSGFSTTSLMLTGAYGVSLGRKSPWFLQWGMAGIFNLYSLEQEVIWSQDIQSGKTSTLSYQRNILDFGGGFMFSNQKVWFGIAGHHFMQPKNGFSSDNQLVIPLKISTHFGGKFPLDHYGEVSLLTNVLYKKQGKSHQGELNASVMFSRVLLGMAYRGLLAPRASTNGALNQDALAFMAGFHLQNDRRSRPKNLSLVYSYDLTVSELRRNSQGSHEISLIYNWTVSQNRSVLCPTF